MKGLASQQGAALFIALIILLLVSLMGVSGMRGGLFQEQMASNSQSEEMTFQAAETAINGVIDKARQNDALLAELMTVSSDKVQCVTKNNGLVDGACGSTTFDARNAFQSEAASRFDRMRPVQNSDAAAIADYQFHTFGKGTLMAGAQFPNRNRQEWRKLGPSGGNFELADPSQIGLSAPSPANGE